MRFGELQGEGVELQGGARYTECWCTVGRVGWDGTAQKLTLVGEGRVSEASQALHHLSEGTD